MAKLNKENADRVASASSSSFDPIPEGVYHAKLRDVDPSRSGPSGPYWVWEYEIVEGEHAGRRMWNNTSLSPQSDWVMKQTFDAFGVDTDTDTDLLVGNIVKLQISQRTIQAGARKGDIGNQVDRVNPPDADFEVAAGSGRTADDDIF